MASSTDAGVKLWIRIDVAWRIELAGCRDQIAVIPPSTVNAAPVM